MATNNVYKPRYTITYLAKNKVWPYKNSRLRRFFALRGRRLHRGGLFRRYVLVFTTRKWTEARRQFRPSTRRTGFGRAGGATTAFGRPRSRRYRDSFYIKQQVRAYHGKRREAAFRAVLKACRTGVSPVTGLSTQSFASSLGTRLDLILFRRRFRPTVYACHQFIRHVGVSVNGNLSFAPQSHLNTGDTISIVPSSVKSTHFAISRVERWRTIAWDLFVRLYYRRWGLYLIRRRLLSQLRKKIRPFARQTALSLPFTYITKRSRSEGFSLVFSKLEQSGTSVSYPAGFSFLFRSLALHNFSPRRVQKLRSYIKIWLALRLRSSFLPRFSRYFGAQDRALAYTRPSRRQSMRRFRLTRRTKVERRRKFPRLQPVHFRFPSYLQIDFRTLQTTLIHMPTSEERPFPFRGSISGVESFYRSRGW